MLGKEFRYNCLFCNYKTDKKSSMQNHFIKQKFCDKKITEKSYQCLILKICEHCEEKYEYKKDHDSVCTVLIDKLKKEEEKKQLTMVINDLKDKIIDLQEEKIKKLQKEKEQREKEQREKEQQLQIQQREQTIINTTNNTVNNTINNTVNNSIVLKNYITIVDYDLFTSKHITKDMIFEYFRSHEDISDIIKYFFVKVFYNVDVPTNHSIYLWNNEDLFLYKERKYIKNETETMDNFLQTYFNSRIKQKLDELFDNSYDENYNITSEEFNAFKSRYKFYKIDTRYKPLDLSFKNFKTTIIDNCSVIEKTIKHKINPNYIRGDLRGILSDDFELEEEENEIENGNEIENENGNEIENE